MSKRVIRTLDAPSPTGPYSQGIRAGNFLFVAGQGALDPKTGKITGEDISSQTRQTLNNIKSIVEASGLTLRDIVTVSIFLKDPDDFKKMNEVYRTFFPKDPPARTTVVASFVAPNMLIEANALACQG